ncbi:MAG: RraA family protein [Alphaproteobacteria bacterium]
MVDRTGETASTIKDAIALCRAELYSPVLADTLDGLGFRRQSPAAPLALLDPETVLCGLARVGLYMPVYHDDEALDVYGIEIELVDSLKPDELPVLVCHGNTRIAPWGELLSTRARHLGAAGCLTDGAVRDVRQIRAMNFPVASAATSPVDTRYRGKMMMYDVPGEIGGVAVESGDLVFADIDGVVIVPAARILETVNAALAKARLETTVRDELLRGDSLATVFARHRIL